MAISPEAKFNASASVEATVPVHDGGVLCDDPSIEGKVSAAGNGDPLAALEGARAVASAWGKHVAVAGIIRAAQAKIAADALALTGIREEVKLGERPEHNELSRCEQVAAAGGASASSTRTRRDRLAAYVILSSIGRLSANALHLPGGDTIHPCISIRSRTPGSACAPRRAVNARPGQRRDRLLTLLPHAGGRKCWHRRGGPKGRTRGEGATLLSWPRAHAALAADAVERGDRVLRQLEVGGREVLAQVADRRRAGDQQDVRARGAAARRARPASAWRRGCVATSDSAVDCSGVKPPSGKNGT